MGATYRFLQKAAVLSPNTQERALWDKLVSERAKPCRRCDGWGSIFENEKDDRFLPQVDICQTCGNASRKNIYGNRETVFRECDLCSGTGVSKQNI